MSHIIRTEIDVIQCTIATSSYPVACTPPPPLYQTRDGTNISEVKGKMYIITVTSSELLKILVIKTNLSQFQ